MTQPVLELDGSQGEGGGQILRTSLALSLITGKPFRLHKIRAGRSRPGLQPQHLTCVRAASTIGQAITRGDSLQSTELEFEPNEVISGKHHFAIGTAGATSLVLHTVYLPLALCGRGPSELTLEGGTHVLASPCYHYLETTWAAYLEQLGLRVELQMHRPGFYPRGGGMVHAKIDTCKRIEGLNLAQRGKVAKATGLSAVAGLPDDIARRQAQRAMSRLKNVGLKAKIHEEKWPGGPGSVLAVILDTEPAPTMFFGLGARGKRAEKVADETVDQVEAYLKAAPAAVDAHSADQLVLPLALAEGDSSFSVAEVTPHLLTNLDVIRVFVNREIVCEGEVGKPGWVRIGKLTEPIRT